MSVVGLIAISLGLGCAVSTPEVAEPLQSCIEDLSQPELLSLSLEGVDLPTEVADSYSDTYYVAYAADEIRNAQDVGQVQHFRTISQSQSPSGCQILSDDPAQDLATALLKHRHQDQVALHQGDLAAAWGSVVNRWERDHYVTGPGDHPFRLAIEDIWIARTLNMPLPDSAPIHVCSAC